jgi:bacteriocin-like protein
MACIQITGLNCSDTELMNELTAEELLAIIGQDVSEELTKLSDKDLQEIVGGCDLHGGIDLGGILFPLTTIRSNSGILFTAST